MAKSMTIPLRNRQRIIVARAIVDGADYEWLSQMSWCRYGGGYAGHRTPNGMVLMHRLILGLESGDPREGDHKNRDRLDNRRVNLRIAKTKSEQQQNLSVPKGKSSRFRGVSFCMYTGRWRAAVVLDGRQHSCGRHDSEIEAAIAAEAFRVENMPFSEPDPELLDRGHVWRQV
jgi:AP2 domain